MGTQGVMDIQVTRDSQVVTGRRGGTDILGLTQGLTGPLEAEDKDIQEALDLQGGSRGPGATKGPRTRKSGGTGTTKGSTGRTGASWGPWGEHGYEWVNPSPYHGSNEYG